MSKPKPPASGRVTARTSSNAAKRTPTRASAKATLQAPAKDPSKLPSSKPPSKPQRPPSHEGLFAGDDGAWRCAWCAATPGYRRYHDEEWGFPVTDDRRLFEKLCLEGFQSGLSWLTILNKREAFRAAFAGFDARRVAAFGPRDVERLLGDAGIVRHRGKIESTINNARRLLELEAEFGSLARYVWRYEPSAPSRPKRLTHAALKAMTTSPESVALSKDLKRRGWSFVGPTTVYAFMQAMGLVNDHLDGCHARAEALRRRAALVL